MSLISVTGDDYDKDIKITRFIVLNDYKGRVNLSSLLAFWHEVVSIINSLPLTSQYLNDPKNVEALSHYHVLLRRGTVRHFHFQEISPKKFMPRNDCDKFSFWHKPFRVVGEQSTSST